MQLSMWNCISDLQTTVFSKQGLVFSDYIGILSSKLTGIISMY